MGFVEEQLDFEILSRSAWSTLFLFEKAESFHYETISRKLMNKVKFYFPIKTITLKTSHHIHLNAWSAMRRLLRKYLVAPSTRHSNIWRRVIPLLYWNPDFDWIVIENLNKIIRWLQRHSIRRGNKTVDWVNKYLSLIGRFENRSSLSDKWSFISHNSWHSKP